ncbi:hypothetical protein C8R43DRAFT_1116993 [Mycena crocata]|nr:hypothetical protein C8R43DRAFT_1116993 [Mycena crocata]
MTSGGPAEFQNTEINATDPSAQKLSAQGSCVDPEPSETAAERINAVLRAYGPGFVLRLCPGAKYKPSRIRSVNQETSTEGYPLVDERAMLVASGLVSADSAVAVDGTRPDCSGVMLRNVQIDGNRRGAPPASGGANVVFAGVNNNQTIQYVRSYDPRSWSCLHITEGPLMGTNTTVQNNDIGPCGVELLDEWADGISVSCKNSVVRNNMIMNPIDGGIALFGSPGTEVYNNTIRVTNQPLLGGINLVDYEPWDGDYTNTVVRDTTIIGGYADERSGAVGTNTGIAVIEIGIAIGPRAWFEDEYLDNITFGATIVADRLSDNVFFDNYTFIGGAGPDCPFNGDSVPAPAPFIYDNSTSNSSVQDDFQFVVEGDLLTCMLPPAGGYYWPQGTAPDLRRGNEPTWDVGSTWLVSSPSNEPNWMLETTTPAIVFGLVVWYLWTSITQYLQRRRTKRTGKHKRNRTHASLTADPIEGLLTRLTYSTDVHLKKRKTF